MKKILLVDTNFSSIPIYNSLRVSGHEVHVIGRNPNDALAKIASKFHCIDYSNTRKLTDLVRREKYDHLVPGCTDRSYESCIESAENSISWLGDNKENFNLIFNKEILKRTAGKLGIPTPKTFEISEALNFAKPIIIKPVDAYSGRGITSINSPYKEKLNEAINTAQKESFSGQFTIEEFTTGQLYSYSAFIRKNKVIVDFIVQEDCINNPFSVDTSKVIHGELESLRRQLSSCIELLAKNLNLANGLIHTQLIKQIDEKFHIIEITRRCPGDLYSKLIEFSTGFPYAEFYAAHFICNEPSIPKKQFAKPVIRHTISFNEEYYSGFSFMLPLKILHYIPIKSIGDKLCNSVNGRAGILFLEEDNHDAFNLLYQDITNKKLSAPSPL